MDFHFLHAADLHIDSPLASLNAKDASVAALFAKANRAAVEALVRQTIEGGAKFLIVAGDVFDGDWKDVSTGLFFAEQLGALHRAGIPTFLIKGNHDADSVVSRTLRAPDSVFTFSNRKGETKLIEPLNVALHGRSYPAREPPSDFLQSYPSRREGFLNIGLLHTSLNGAPGHDPYAPCTVEDLKRFGYDYWALGHIHAAEIVARDPFVVYPGNIQGRSVRETGAKGAMKVTVEDGRIVDVTPVVLDAARWAHEEVDVSGIADIEGVFAPIREALARAHAPRGERPLAARLTLTGLTSAHTKLIANGETLEAEARALALQISADLWVEKLKIATRPMPHAGPDEADALDVDALIAGAADDPEFAGVVAELVGAVAEKLPREAREAFEGDAQSLAQRVAEARDFLIGAR
jgi:DNA repair exonuclease SbcCD nuclease subunit